MKDNKLNILIADDEPITRMDLRELLQESGYNVVAEAGDGFDAVEACKKHHPDLVLMDIKMPYLDGLSASRLIIEENLADAVVLLTAYGEKEFVEEAKAIGISGYLVKPINAKSLIPTIELLFKHIHEIKKLRRDINEISERFENRTIIEKAKGRVMEELSMTEEEAYRYIKNLSLCKSISMRHVADLILQQSKVDTRCRRKAQ
ncbi:MAG TPA: response regulator [Synergistaceae bacterium]|jgi:AmiR/NasT family two-component response regulator|nr:response regulator [Synergistaceae bacterium]MDD3672228.1 response regulator [Synergistaceae bacterium]MDD4704765.1 response regulator [Synergistaceae bacterium]MDY0283699.1 response regulator [Synergistaceae bacterium]HPX03424.1 response regulator [Synergistaceae bacterium]